MFYLQNASTNDVVLAPSFTYPPGWSGWVLQPVTDWTNGPMSGTLTETGINYVVFHGGNTPSVLDLDWCWYAPLLLFVLWRTYKMITRAFARSFGSSADDALGD